VARLLSHLDRVAPGAGWGEYLEGDRPRWSRVVVAGHSHGASSSGLIGTVREVDRVVMLSGPFDNRAGQSAAWTRRQPRTPRERYYLFSHTQEEQYPQHIKDWEAMGMGRLGPLVMVEDGAPPFGNSHQLVTALAPPPGKNPHGVTAAGSASPKGTDGGYVLTPVFRYLFGR
jgi:hypothetical protein